MKLTTHLHLVPSSKNVWSYTFTPPIRLYGVVISYEKHGDKFAIYLFLCPFGTGGSFPVAIPPSTGTN